MRISDWSSDVCSSDLGLRHRPGRSGGTTPRHVRRRVTTCTGTTAYNPRCPTVRTAMRSILPVIACLVLLSAGCERASLTAVGVTAEAAGNDAAGTARTEIGRASHRERVRPYVQLSVDAEPLNKKKQQPT